MIKKKETQQLHSNISLWLDDYSDIFSDFDPRDSSVRAISVDFLEEAKRAAIDKSEGLELNLLVPKSKRDQTTEQVIKRRLKNHFERHHKMLKKEAIISNKKGFIFVLTGVIIMALAAYVLVNYEGATAASFLLILLEPAGWFFFWEGLSIVLFKPKESKLELDFYKKLSRAEINFNFYSSKG